MARKKNYNDDEVIEKATEIFWRNGYENTSMSALESSMGINKFSIYSSFGNKQGVFLQSLKCYRNKLLPIVTKLENSSQGILAIKEYFYDSLAIYADTLAVNHSQPTYFRSKGCLMTNTRGELQGECNEIILNEIESFISYQKKLFIEKLTFDGITKEQAKKNANYLIIAKQAVSVASKVHSQDEIHDFIEMTFKAI